MCGGAPPAGRRPAGRPSVCVFHTPLAAGFTMAENPLRGAPADPERYGCTTYEVTWAAPHVLSVAMNRPARRNAQNPAMWDETKHVFDAAGTDPECRVVLFSGNGKMFTSGIDLSQSFVSSSEGVLGAATEQQQQQRQPDVARRAMAQLGGIVRTQSLFNAIEECRVPVIACIHRCEQADL